MHGVSIRVKRVKARIGEPRLVEVDPRDALAQELDDAIGAIAQAVVGRVRDDGVHGRLLGGVVGKRARGHRIGDRFRREPRRRDRSDDRRSRCVMA